MFPNQSSSYEIFKTNAFVQSSVEDESGDVIGMAQPHISNNPLIQVPDTRDEMVVMMTGRVVEGDPSLTVITGHPSHAPAKILSALACEMESDGSSKMPGAERQQTDALCNSIKSISEIRDKNFNLRMINASQSTTLWNIPKTNDDSLDGSSFKICDYSCGKWEEMNNVREKGQREGRTPEVLRLRGGGENSLTTGTTGWGSPPSSQGTGWTGGASSQSSQAQQTTTGNNAGNQSTGQQQPQQWGANNNNNGGCQRPSGGGGAQGGGPGQQTQVGPTSQTQASSTALTSSVSSPPAGMNPVGQQNQSNANTSNQMNNNGQSGGIAQNGANQQGQNSANSAQPGSGSGVGGSAQTGSSGSGGPSWAQAAGKGLSQQNSGQSVQQPIQTNNQPGNGGGGAGSVVPAGGGTAAPPSTSTKQQMEQLNTMREALFSHDGWGGQNVNQDSNWDIPGSPEPGNKEGNNATPGPMWKVPINNGTELWEVNLRNGGIPPPQNPTQKAPWGHTPSSNIGGTWGEEDDMDSSNMWTGVPPGASSNPQWASEPPHLWAGASGAKKENWGGPNWNEQRDPRDLRHGEMRQVIDARETMRPTTIEHRNMGGNDLLMRGGGISGRLNGVTNEAMWSAGPAGPHHHIPHHQGKLPNHPNQPGVNQWAGGGGGPPMKDMGNLAGKSTGWEEPSPPPQRRNMPNYDDGTSLWGQQHTRPAMPAGQNKVSHWKEMPAAAGGGMGRGIPLPPGRGNPNIKPDQPLWSHHPSRNGGWGETGGIDAGPWADDKPAPWIDQPLAPSSWQGGPKHKPSWEGPELDSAPWAAHPNKQPTKSVSKETIWNSRQFRILTDMGYKKEEAEGALRTSSLSLDEALEQLTSSGNAGRWRHSPLDPDQGLINPYPSPQQAICIPFQANGGGGGGGGNSGGANVLANPNPNLSTLSPAIMQKLLSQQPPAPAQQQPAPFNQSSRAQQTQQQPSPQQLRLLVQQIQMAVQSNYLSPQILNQPLAPQTLILLNTLLQQIKNLQQLTQHHAVLQVNTLGKPSNSQLLQISVQITKTKQQISNLQNQIAAQQAVYVKQQQHQMPPTADFTKGGLPEPTSSFQPNFVDQVLPQSGGTGQQSRLNQWTRSQVLDKDSDLGSGNDFSRAPGTTTKPTPGNSSPNINPLLGQPDGPWSSVNRSNCDTGWPDSGNDDNSSKDWPSASQAPPQAFSDLVPEFEPGKPWKGNPLKSIEDDPTLTPGSVVRSPLSLPSIKDTHILSSGSSAGQGKASPTTSSSGLDPIQPTPLLPSFSSSTWSFNPPVSSNSDLFDSGKLSSGGKSVNSGNGGGSNSSGGGGTWGEGGVVQSGGGGQQSSGNELWAAPKSRGPPPGLSGKPQSGGGQSGGQQSGGASSGAPTTNGWLSSRWGPQTSWSQPATGSTWLLLRNLTPQIDGSTLKTLCIQHGPLLNFHLYLNHGIALAKYESRDEANKAQGALNNCVLGNTTIFAESPSESDVLTLLQHLGHSTGGQTGGGGGGGGGNSWRPQVSKEQASWATGGGGAQTLWGPSGAGAGTASGGSLWGDPASEQHRATPSSINSFLPNDLLGNESM